MGRRKAATDLERIALDKKRFNALDHDAQYEIVIQTLHRAHETSTMPRIYMSVLSEDRPPFPVTHNGKNRWMAVYSKKDLLNAWAWILKAYRSGYPVFFSPNKNSSATGVWS